MSGTSVPAYSHIVVVMEENHNYDEIIGNTAEAPFINSLAAGGAILGNLSAITHPSQPNYLALYAGSTFGTSSDNIVSEPDPTLDTILKAAGKTFTGYVDEGGLGSDQNHNPWESFPEGYSVQTDFTSFTSLLPSGNYASLPSVSFVIPSISDDMHTGTIQQGDSWLQANLAAYAQWALSNNSLLMVVWDEDDDTTSNPYEPSNQIPGIVYGAGVVPGTYDTAYNDYNILSTITGAFGLTGPNNAATASPIQVFGGETISATTTGPLVLNSTDNPLVISGTGRLSATGAGNDAINGPTGTPWAIENNGTVTSASDVAIALQSGGAVSNGVSSGAAATISGDINGIAIYGAAGEVVNDGRISATAGSGILLVGSVTAFAYGYAAGSSNSVTNAVGAAISGLSNGVYIEAATTGSVTNSGSISASGGAGVDLGNTGNVTNNAGASISGSQFGIFLGGAGTVTNTGTVSGATYDGIILETGGSITNNAGGFTSGHTSGVYAKSKAAGTMTNAGSVIGVTSDAIILADGGSVSNAVAGVVAGGADGIHVIGASGVIANGGTITGGTASGYGLLLGAGGSLTNAGFVSGRDGIGLSAGGNVTNSAGGTISGLGTAGVGLFVAGSPGTIVNAGRLTGNHLGILDDSGGTITNSTGGLIQGPSAGILTNGFSATIVNGGSVSATAGTGFDMEDGGTLTNNAGGSVYGSGDGLVVTGGIGMLTNFGSVSGGPTIGVLFEAGGTVTNQVSASISGSTAGFFSNNDPVTLANSGRISASSGAAADIEGGGVVTNNVGGVVSGSTFGVFVFGGAGTVSNAGSIAGTASDGIVLSKGGSATNLAGGAITGGSAAIYARSGAAGTVTNSGKISATSSGSSGVDLGGGGSVTNNATASISGASFGVFLSGGTGTVVNAGSIAGTANIAVDLAAGGTVSNAVGGSISASGIGVAVYASGGTVTNAGTITGGFAAVDFGNTASNRLVVDPGAVFNGNVLAGAGSNTLELAAGSSAGSLAIGNNFTGFGTVAVDSGATWTLTGSNAAGTILNDGTLIVAASGNLTVSSAINPSSTGLFELDGGAAVTIAADAGSADKIAFLGSAEAIIDTASLFGTNVGQSSYAGPLIEDFVTGDSIDLKNIAAAGATLDYTGTTGLLQIVSGGVNVASLSFQTSSLGSGGFHSASDGGSGLLLTHS